MAGNRCANVASTMSSYTAGVVVLLLLLLPGKWNRCHAGAPAVDVASGPKRVNHARKSTSGTVRGMGARRTLLGTV
jgi:hypothetical protein